MRLTEKEVSVRERQFSQLITAARIADHDVSQPATAIMCILELGAMQGTEMAMREAIESALMEGQRLIECMHSLRTILSGWTLPEGAGE